MTFAEEFDKYVIELYGKDLPKVKRRKEEEIDTISYQMSLRELVDTYGYDVEIEPDVYTDYGSESPYFRVIKVTEVYEEMTDYEKMEVIKKMPFTQDELDKMDEDFKREMNIKINNEINQKIKELSSELESLMMMKSHSMANKVYGWFLS